MYLTFHCSVLCGSIPFKLLPVFLRGGEVIKGKIHNGEFSLRGRSFDLGVEGMLGGLWVFVGRQNFFFRKKLTQTIFSLHYKIVCNNVKQLWALFHFFSLQDMVVFILKSILFLFHQTQTFKRDVTCCVFMS